MKTSEQAQILALLKASAEVKKVDEGGLFRTKYVHYLYGSITNEAAVATVEDIKLRLDFFSKTDAKITSNELMLYEFILPNHEHSFKEKINWPDEAITYQLRILDAEIN